MDEKLFLQRLSEVSEWHRPKLGPNGALSTNKRAKDLPEHPGPITEEQLDLMTDAEAEDYYERLMAWRATQPNNSVPPEILKVKIQAVDCEDCGVHCAEGRRVETRLCSTGQRHWRTRCEACNLYKDPATGQFSIEPQVAHSYLMSYYRPKLGLNNSKHQKVNKNPDPQIKTQLKQIVRYETEDAILYVREPISPREK